MDRIETLPRVGGGQRGGNEQLGDGDAGAGWVSGEKDCNSTASLHATRLLLLLSFCTFILLNGKDHRQFYWLTKANKGLSSQGYGFSSGHVWM